MASSTLEVTDLGYKVADLSLATGPEGNHHRPSRRCRVGVDPEQVCGRKPWPGWRITGSLT